MSRVREFHIAFDQPAPNGPTLPDADLAALRLRLIAEEYNEVRDDLTALLRALRADASSADLHEIMQRVVKEVCDLRYVAEGALVAFGVEPVAYDEVHRSNMSKLGEDGRPVRRADNKVLKGPNYSPADPDLMFPPVIDHKEESSTPQPS